MENGGWKMGWGMRDGVDGDRGFGVEVGNGEWGMVTDENGE